MNEGGFMHRLRGLAVATLAFGVTALAGAGSAQAQGQTDTVLTGSAPATAPVGASVIHQLILTNGAETTVALSLTGVIDTQMDGTPSAAGTAPNPFCFTSPAILCFAGSPVLAGQTLEVRVSFTCREAGTVTTQVVGTPTPPLQEADPSDNSIELTTRCTEIHRHRHGHNHLHSNGRNHRHFHTHTHDHSTHHVH
jgi:hypothetical protein